MDSPQNRPDERPAPHEMVFGETEADGRVLLPANITTVMAEELRARLVLAADHDEAIIIDAAETESIGQAALQLLIAAKREADRLDLPFTIENAGSALRKRITTLGLADILDMEREGKPDQ